MADPPPDVRWQALLVGVASNSRSEDPGFVQSLNSQAEFALALERNMPGLSEDDLIVAPEPRYAHEVTDAIALLNESHDSDGDAGRTRPGLLFYYCGHGMNADGRLYLSVVETVDDDANRRRSGLALSEVLAAIGATAFPRRRVALILDCCFAGLAGEAPELGRAHLLMAVGRKDKATHDPGSTGPTNFTGALVELLREGDPGAGPWIDLETAHTWMEPRLVESHGEQRRPYLRAGKGGPVVLGRNVGYQGPPADATDRSVT